VKNATSSARRLPSQETTRPRTWLAGAALLVAFTLTLFATPGQAANYALLINGDPTFSHTRNVEIAAEALGSLNYPAANILRAKDAGEIRAAIRDLGGRLRADDVLLIYTTGHGERRRDGSRLYLRQGEIGANELAKAVFALPFRRLIYVGDQCYSGGFATAFGATARNVVAVTATDDTHMARCEPFVRPFWRAAVEDKASVEAAYRVASEGAKRALDASPESNTRYVASGDAAAHENSFGG
jgi:hypothetical protein